jgi:ABC-type amino acid transport system permease subunit
MLTLTSRTSRLLIVSVILGLVNGTVSFLLFEDAHIAIEIAVGNCVSIFTMTPIVNQLLITRYALACGVGVSGDRIGTLPCRCRSLVNGEQYSSTR